MTEQEIMELEEKIWKGLQLAEKRMLEEKALRNENVIVQTDDGTIQHIPARQVLATM